MSYLSSKYKNKNSLRKKFFEQNNFQERVTGLQRAIAQLDAKKRETERAAQRLEKDKSLLKKSMHTVSYLKKDSQIPKNLKIHNL